MDKFLFKRGNQAKLPQLQTGEPFLSKDEERLYIGGNNGNIPLPNKQDMDEVTTQLAQKAEKSNVLYEKKSLIYNSDFETLPLIQSRSSVYQFIPNIIDPQINGKKSLKIESLNYATSTDSNKDFAFVLREKIMPTEKLKVSFWVYPSVSNHSILIRMAFTSGVMVNLGNANQWNKIELELDLASMTQGNDYLYFDLAGSLTLYLSDFNVSVLEQNIKDIPISFTEVYEKLNENPQFVQNSSGIIERMIDVAQSYLNNVSNFVYGNAYTAYDKDVQQVNGKYQIDCSSFANLLIHGVPYENSRYNGNTENKGSNLFFQNLDPFKFRYANQIGKYAFDKGYAFKPKADFSNLRPGDVLFFSWNDGISGDLPQEFRDAAFMKIDHVAVFLHKRNDNLWATLQFDNGISTVYYNVNDEYMNQCVLAARFPFSNAENMYQQDNLLVDGDKPKSTTTSPVVGSYHSSKPFQKGRYYTLVLEGQVVTENCYFVLQVNGKTVHSDSVKASGYNGVLTMRFPYLLDDVSDTITIAIGAPSGTSEVRSASVNWCSLYEGYKTEKKYFVRNNNTDTIKDFPLNESLVTMLDSDFSPYYKYMLEGNKIIFNFSLPFNSYRTGTLVLGTLDYAIAPTNTQRMPIIIKDSANNPLFAVLQVRWNGEVSIIPYNTNVQWSHALANCVVFRD